MMIDKKLTVVWLCYFTNLEVQNKLAPLKKSNEIAPWISGMIPLFENSDDIELHVISPHEWLPRHKTFKKNKITYHFLNKGIPFLGRHWPGFFRFDQWTEFYQLKKNVANIINKIKPDLIHLHGAENEFCTSITQFRSQYPVFITVQGFVHHSNFGGGKAFQKRCQKEIEIINTFKHFGCRTETMGNQIKAVNPQAVLHWHNYPMPKITPIDSEKKFDLVFFARLSKDKGIDDLLKATAILKEYIPAISLCVIGGGNTEPLKKHAEDLGIGPNVTWAGFLPTRTDVHQLASAAKVSVLPTYHDIIPGTIVESLFLKLAVVTYDVGSIHELNKYEDIVSLVEKGHVKQLAKEIMKLLKDEELRSRKADLGYVRALDMFGKSYDEIRNSIKNAYLSVVESFQSELKR